MLLIKEYREAKNLTQMGLVVEMRPHFPWVDVPLISKIESGKCMPTPSMEEWACKSLYDLLESERLSDGVVDRLKDKVSENADFTPLMAKVYEALKQTDKDNRLTRAKLVKITGIDDRRSRDLLEEMRAKGIRIGSGQGKEGYWLIRSELEYKKFIAEYSSRAYTVLKNKSAMDNYVEGQIRI